MNFDDAHRYLQEKYQSMMAICEECRDRDSDLRKSAREASKLSSLHKTALGDERDTEDESLSGLSACFTPLLRRWTEMLEQLPEAERSDLARLCKAANSTKAARVYDLSDDYPEVVAESAHALVLGSELSHTLLLRCESALNSGLGRYRLVSFVRDIKALSLERKLRAEFKEIVPASIRSLKNASRRKKKNMSRQNADAILIDLLKNDSEKYAAMSQRQLAKAVGCSRDTLRATDAYAAIGTIREELRNRRMA